MMQWLRASAFIAALGLMVASGVYASELSANSHELKVLKSLQKEAGFAAEQCLPLVIMVSQFGCEYCEKLRRQVLLPLLKSGEFTHKALIRELLIDPDETVIDLDGSESTGLIVASQYLQNIMTPTVLVLNAAGDEIAERIVGIGNIDFYGSYLETEINAAYKHTQQACL